MTRSPARPSSAASLTGLATAALLPTRLRSLDGPWRESPEVLEFSWYLWTRSWSRSLSFVGSSLDPTPLSPGSAPDPSPPHLHGELLTTQSHQELKLLAADRSRFFEADQERDEPLVFVKREL